MKKCRLCSHFSEGERRCPVCHTDVSCLPNLHWQESFQPVQNTELVKHCCCNQINKGNALTCLRCGYILFNVKAVVKEYDSQKIRLRIKDGRIIVVPKEGGVLGRDYIGKTEFKDDPFISGCQAILRPYLRKYYLEGINCKNRVYLNDKAINSGESCILNSGDNLKIGLTEMMVEITVLNR